MSQSFMIFAELTDNIPLPDIEIPSMVASSADMQANYSENEPHMYHLKPPFHLAESPKHVQRPDRHEVLPWCPVAEQVPLGPHTGSQCIPEKTWPSSTRIARELHSRSRTYPAPRCPRESFILQSSKVSLNIPDIEPSPSFLTIVGPTRSNWHSEGRLRRKIAAVLG